MFTKLCAFLTAVGALHGTVQWYTNHNYVSDMLGAQMTMAIHTVVGLAAVGLLAGTFKGKSAKSKK
jgi:uncharacterized membrane protein YuzA (DUF378 family)